MSTEWTRNRKSDCELDVREDKVTPSRELLAIRGAARMKGAQTEVNSIVLCCSW